VVLAREWLSEIAHPAEPLSRPGAAFGGSYEGGVGIERPPRDAPAAFAASADDLESGMRAKRGERGTKRSVEDGSTFCVAKSL